MNSPEDAEEVLQEAFVKAFFSIKNFKGNASFYTWLYRIVFNMAIDVKRKQKRRGGDKLELTEDRLEEQNIHAPGLGVTHFKQPDEEIMQKKEFETANALLNSLSNDHKEVITMREIDGLSYDEIAETLKVSRGTVMSRIFYARKKIQEFLSEKKEDALLSVKKVCAV